MKKRTLKNQSGQAVVEYVLMLVVIVAIGMGILTQFGQGFASYADNYFGAYFECLLQAGELPSLGGDADSQCDDAFQAFTLGEGRPPSPGSTYTGGGDPPGSKKPSSKSAITEGTTAKGSRTKVGYGSGGGRGGLGRRGKFQSQFGDKQSGSGTQGNASKKSESDIEKSKTRNVSTTEEIVYVDGEGVKGSLVPIYGQREEEEKGDLSPQNVPLKKEAKEELSPERVPATSKNKKNALKEKEEPMDFGDFLRYLIIGAIVVIILVFFGGQIMQFQKSME